MRRDCPHPECPKTVVGRRFVCKAHWDELSDDTRARFLALDATRELMRRQRSISPAQETAYMQALAAILRDCFVDWGHLDPELKDWTADEAEEVQTGRVRRIFTRGRS